MVLVLVSKNEIHSVLSINHSYTRCCLSPFGLNRLEVPAAGIIIRIRLHNLDVVVPRTDDPVVMIDKADDALVVLELLALALVALLCGGSLGFELFEAEVEVGVHVDEPAVPEGPALVRVIRAQVVVVVNDGSAGVGGAVLVVEHAMVLAVADDELAVREGHF